nr:WYL domain-containing protein [Streptomyces sp. SID5476]
MRFEYRDLPQSRTCSTGGPIGAATRRTVEPHRLVCTERRWYLVAWDVDRVGWRTFRVDRVTPTPPHGPRFTPREPPAEDLAAYVSRGVSTTVYASHAVVRLLVPLHEAAELISPSAGTLEAYDEHSCLLRTGAPNLTGTIRTLRDRLSAALDRTGDAASAPGPSGSGAA